MARPPVIIDQYGRPVQRAALKQEIAGPTVTGVRSPVSGYPGDGLNPRRLASIMRDADQGEPLRYLELAETIEERDLHYAGVLGTRKRSVSQLDVTVEAAADDAASVGHADMVREWLQRDALQDELFNMLDAIGKGISFNEIVWDTSAGEWRPARIEWRDPRWFRFDRIDGTTPLLRSAGGDEPLPAFKFIVAVVRAKSGLPIRSGLARLAAWAWMFKAFTQRDWAIFTQTFGQPIRVGKYAPNATEEQKETLFRAVANIAGDCAAIVPDGMVIEFIESKNVGQGSDLFLKRSDWLDQQVSKAVLGQTGTTDAIAGGYSVGKVQRNVQEDIERADARALGAILNRDLVRPWIDLQYGPQPAYPKLRIGRPEERDLKVTITALEKLVPMGLRVERSVIADMFGLPDAPPDAEVLMPSRSPVADAGDEEDADPDADPDETVDDDEVDEEAAVAARQAAGALAGEDAIDRLAAEAEAAVGPGTDALIDTIRRTVEAAVTLEEVRDRLLALRPGMPAAGVAALMRLALVYAELSGRSEIADG
jgi:phage gp29-like protein